MHYFKQQKLEFKQLIDDTTINFLSPCVEVQNRSEEHTSELQSP